MDRTLCTAALGALFVALASPIVGVAQPTPSIQSTPPPYRPGLGDLMTMTVQPRHLKLGIAALEKNWVYAAYEHHQLEEALDRVVRYWPQWRNFPIADMMAVTREPMRLCYIHQEPRRKRLRSGVPTTHRQLQLVSRERQRWHQSDCRS